MEKNLEFIQYEVNNRRYRHKTALQIILLFPHLEVVKRRSKAKKRKRRKSQKEKEERKTVYLKTSVFRIHT